MVTNYMRTGPARIVLAEDDRAIACLIEIALKRTKIPHELEIVHDGLQAIAAVETPTDLLLLDLYMPGKDGFEVLQYLKQHEQLRRMPVIMFSNSDLAAHVTKAYDLSVNAFVRKNTDFGELCHTIDMILRFWLQIAVAPY
jgi:chemotaxis family two-component system response regulator Rcp1